MARITFLRHGHAVAADGAPDRTRKLSDKGRMQAGKRREQLGNPDFHFIITSQIIRAIETALEIAGETNEAVLVARHELFTPHEGDTHDALERLLGRFGHNSLATYYAYDSPDVEHMKEFGKIGWGVILEEIRLFSDATNILSVGHGMYPACMVHAADHEKAACLMEVVWDECSGFTVELDDDFKVQRVELLPPLE